MLAVSEACNNAIEHAYDGGGPGRSCSGPKPREGSVRIEVADRGHWLVPEANDERGRGIHLMKSFIDRVEIDTSSDGTRVVLERDRGGAGSPAAHPGRARLGRS